LRQWRKVVEGSNTRLPPTEDFRDGVEMNSIALALARAFLVVNTELGRAASTTGRIAQCFASFLGIPQTRVRIAGAMP
jgi:hypothetical protein